MTIKRKSLLLSVILLTVLLVLAALIACDPTADKVDKASQNQEFVSFRKKVIKILKDNGIFVNDLDKTTATAVDNGGKTYATANSLYANSNEVNADIIKDVASVMEKNEYLSNEDYNLALRQVYAMALKTSLCIGDGISNYFGEKQLYNIPVYIPTLYMVVVNDGNVTSLYTYQNSGGEYFQRIDVVFDSDDSYYFTVTVTEENWTEFFYGNSQKQFLMLSVGNQAIYSPNGADFYATEDKKALNDVSSAMDVYFDGNINKAEYRKIKDNVKYSFNQEQSQALNDKYFKDVQSSAAPQEKGVRFEDIGGKQVAVEYSAVDGETEVVIPSEVRYLSNQFRVYDWEGNVESLVIPSSVTAVVDEEGKAVTEYNQIRIVLQSHNEDERFFSEITVEQGSPLFKSGQGHLTLKQNDYIVTIVDKPLESLDFDVLAAAICQRENGVLSNLYKLSADEITVDSGKYNDAVEKYGVGQDWLNREIIKVLNYANPSTLNYDLSTVKPTQWGSAGIGLTINLKKDMTLNIAASTAIEWNDVVLASLDYKNVSSNKLNLTVNVNENAVMSYVNVNPVQPEFNKPDDGSYWEKPEYVSDGTVFTTINIPVEQNLYEFLFANPYDGTYQRLTRDERNSAVKFAESTLGEEFANFKVVGGAGSEFATVRIASDVQDGVAVTVPSKFYGYDVECFQITSVLADKNVTVTVPDGISITLIQDEGVGLVFNNDNFRLKFGGTIEELRSMFSYYYSEGHTYPYDVQFTAECSDVTDIIKIGWAYSVENPDNEEFYKHTVTVRFNGETLTYKISDSDGGKRLGYDESDTAYFMIDANGGTVPVYFEPYEGVNRVDFPAGQDGEYTLRSVKLGEYDIKCLGDNFNLAVKYTVRQLELPYSECKYYAIEINEVSGKAFEAPVVMLHSIEETNANRLIGSLVMMESTDKNNCFNFELLIDVFNATAQIVSGGPEEKEVM